MRKTSGLSERLRTLSEDMTIDLTETTVKYRLPLQKSRIHTSQQTQGETKAQNGVLKRENLSIDKAAKVCCSEDQNF